MSATPSKSILLIDDDDLIAGSLRQVLLSARCDVDVAIDSAAARAMMAQRGYDIVMVDPYLTGSVHKDGCDLIKNIQMQQPAANLIVLTGYSSPELAQSAVDGRITALLSKPQSIPFLSQFLVGMPLEPIETSIKGQTI
ncbi:MAG TPA: response regulator [Thermoanaerobaculia bacterium]|jgi:DNA-binding NtrC family response regulator|nr:response regulator [Thermoanaerobaculia bacterium]